MWEAITPRDQDPKRAYLEGVDSSDALVLLLGSLYGVADSSGYSPTHEEANRARDQRIPRLLFVRSDVSSAARSGKLNEWMRELYNEVAGAQYDTPASLCAQLEQQLRETAARQESLWLKLGPLVFPGRVAQRRTNGQAVYTVTARVRDGAVRRALGGLGALGSGIRGDRLTWSTQTEPVTVQEVVTTTERSSVSDVTIVCAQPRDHYGGGSSGIMPVTHIGPMGQSFGPAEQAEAWARTAVFGKPESNHDERRAANMSWMLTPHVGPVLPEVLAAQQADGWLAEGLTRLFIVEHVSLRYGHVEQLDVGPATSTAVRVRATFTLSGTVAKASISGAVPLR
jgi:hypothetical protein